MARIKNKTKIGYWDNDIVEKTVEAVQNLNLNEPVLIILIFIFYHYKVFHYIYFLLIRLLH